MRYAQKEAYRIFFRKKGKSPLRRSKSKKIFLLLAVFYIKPDVFVFPLEKPAILLYYFIIRVPNLFFLARIDFLEE